jgi:rare lipoprotein A
MDKLNRLNVSEGRGTRAFWLVCASALALTACASSGPKVTYVKKSRSTEYFSETDYGVKASPRVVDVAMSVMTLGHAKRLPRGGGRDQVGKPYQVRGKWYYPTVDPHFKQTGIASWYGDAFHGRLTANGEIYDMNMLSAAHPTMPLPSYARVTNKANGNSVIVRVNDRGPYANGRAIDLSRKAAEMLDYTGTGTAQVNIEYIGRAPIDGNDDAYLLASYQPGRGQPQIPGQSDVMVAMNTQAAPSQQISNDGAVLSLAADEGYVPPVRVSAQQEPFDPFAADADIQLPDSGPLPINRPQECLLGELCAPGGGDLKGSLLSGYADSRVSAANRAAPAFAALGLSQSSIKAWKQGVEAERILVGTYTKADFKKLKLSLSGLASVSTETGADGSIEIYAVAKSNHKTDDVLRAAWKNGFVDAFVVR